VRRKERGEAGLFGGVLNPTKGPKHNASKIPQNISQKILNTGIKPGKEKQTDRKNNKSKRLYIPKAFSKGVGGVGGTTQKTRAGIKKPRPGLDWCANK